jgi:lipopolysaccharide/colanic/teichoic acid biosynthesis glycosyltransferase
MSMLRNPDSLLNRAYRAVGKRALDLVLAVPALWVALALVAAVGVAVRANLGAPIWFRHRRPGLHGEPFELLKFRTMRNGAGTDAERLTALGAFLRRSRSMNCRSCGMWPRRDESRRTAPTADGISAALQARACTTSNRV